jgi:hypothetical protein
MPTPDQKPSEAAQDWPQDTPIVFAVRPTKYEVVRSEDLDQWEAEAAKHLGAEVSAARGTGTWSFSSIGGGYETFDDSDYIPVVLED